MDALQLKSVNKTYETRATMTRAVSNLSFTVKSGTVFGFLGPNGAGKTTTMKMMVGLVHPLSGTISIFGERAGTMPAARHIGFLPENPTLYRYLSALELVTMHGQLMGLTKTASAKEARRLLDIVGLRDAQNRRIREYSKGMVQRTGLAIALIGDPNLLFLDEPFDGLDVLGRFEMKTLIQTLRQDKKTIFFNSHILSDVEELCDNIGIIDQGKLLECGPIKTFIGKSQTLEQYFVKRLAKERQHD